MLGSKAFILHFGGKFKCDLQKPMAGTVGGAAGELRAWDQSQDGRGSSRHALRQGRRLTQQIQLDF